MIQKTIIISERKQYVLRVTFCAPGIRDYRLSVTPLMSRSARLDAFPSAEATETVTMTLVAGESPLHYKTGDRTQAGSQRLYPVLEMVAYPGKISTAGDFIWPFPGPSDGWFVPSQPIGRFDRFSRSYSNGVLDFSFFFGTTFVQPAPRDPTSALNHPSLYRYSLHETNGLGGPEIGQVLASGKIRIQISSTSPATGNGVCKYEVLV